MATWNSEGRTIRAMLSDLFEYQEPSDVFDEYDLYEVCRTKIRSKKDKFKSIKVALDELIERHFVVKSLNKFGVPIYRSAWHENLELLAKGELELRKWEEGDLEARVRRGYNIIFEADIPNRWADLEAFNRLPENAASHYFEFSERLFRLIREMGDPDSYVSWDKRVFNSP